MQWDREGAESALQQAREIRSNLGDAQSSNRGDYLRCVRLYKRVWLSDPHYSGCDDAIYEAALLYQEMSGKFKAPEYIQESADLLRFLLKDYSVSPFRRDARARLAALEGQSPESAPVQAAMEVRTTDASARTVPQASPAAPQGVSPPTDHAADATAGAAGHGGPATVQSIRHWSAGDRTRVMIDVDGPVRFQSGKVENPDRLFFDLSNA
ncbi:MAG: N-acetylmuramoyl-L-alanine amidase, partial [Acidobacteria bacterium]|nr:N-acetylmuramoyl-L-alanine amidase [Acidobacteriota bacterium]